MEEINNQYPRLQYSYFLDNGAQVVIRGEVITAFNADVATMQSQYPPKGAQSHATGISVPSNEPVRYDNRPVQAESKTTTDHYCQIHQKELKRRETNYVVVWDHRQQIDGVWNTCYGQGWKTQK